MKKVHWKELADTFERLASKKYEDSNPKRMEGLHYWAGLARYHLKEFMLARSHFETALEDYPNGEYNKDALVYLQSGNE